VGVAQVRQSDDDGRDQDEPLHGLLHFLISPT
jgi:hypothetical protein